MVEIPEWVALYCLRHLEHVERNVDPEDFPKLKEAIKELRKVWEE